MIDVHNDATSDLRALYEKDPVGGAKVIALVQQMKLDTSLREKLLEHDFADKDLGVRKWLRLWKGRPRKPVWRWRAWSLERQGLDFRFIYIFDWRSNRFHLLAVVSKDAFDYDNPDDPICKRVEATLAREFRGI